MTWLRAFGFEPDIDNLPGQRGPNEARSQRQNVGIVMRATVACTGDVIGQRGPDAWNLVRGHAGTDTCPVNHDADIRGALRHGIGDRSGIDRVVNCFTG